MSTTTTTPNTVPVVTYTVDTLTSDQITLSDVIKGKNSQKKVYANVKTPGGGRGNRVLLQTPLMSSPFGLSRYVPKPSKTGEPPKEPVVGDNMNYSFQLSFNDRETNPKTSKLYDLVEGIEKRVVDAAATNSVSWFGKKMSRETVDALFTSALVQPKDDKYQPTFKLKVDSSKTESGVTFRGLRVFDENQKQVDPVDYLVKHVRGRFIIQLDYIWFMDKTFGVKWSLQQAKLSPATKLPDYAFVPDSDDETPVSQDSQPERQPHPSDSESDPDVPEQADSDSDDELSAAQAKVAPAPAAVPEPVVAAAAPPPAKRTVLKKK